jgi:hypothetical protein
MEGIHLPLDKGVVEPARHLQTARHIVVVATADLRFPPFLVRHVGVAVTRGNLGKGVEKGAIEVGADDADQGCRGGIGHGGRAQVHPPFVRRLRGHDLGGQPGARDGGGQALYEDVELTRGPIGAFIGDMETGFVLGGDRIEVHPGMGFNILDISR